MSLPASPFHTKAPLWLNYSLSQEPMTTGGLEARGPATQLPVPAGYSDGPDRADVMKLDYVFGQRSGKGEAFHSGCNNH